MIDLSSTFLSAVQVDGNRGVLMVEGASTFATLHLDVVRSATDELIASAHLPLSLSGVEEMYRTANLRGMTNPGVLAEPPNNPDSSGNGKNLVFLHGYQPDSGESDDMTAWLSEMFKRFHQSGASAKFHGVLWFSNQGDQMDYQKNVVNAFQTAPVLKDYVGGLNGEVVVVAHSLGNMVVSSAIADHNMAVSKYMMCDAAVASEAYDSTMGKEDRLVNPMWIGYHENTWAANWHMLFESNGDSRRKLKWLDRFKKVATKIEVCNFYSSGDEVFELISGCDLFTGVFGGLDVNWTLLFPVVLPVIEENLGRYSWQKQELFKGMRYSNGWTSFGGTTSAGWGFDSTLVGTAFTLQVVPTFTRDAANVASDAVLKNSPIFTRMPDWLVGTNVLVQSHIDEMLAMGIPALTPSAGRTAINSFLQNDRPQFNLNTDPGNASGFKPNGWPTAGHLKQDDGLWLHNDMKDVAFFFTYKLYERIFKAGGLD